MFYREAGQFKTSYTADEAIFPILQDRFFIGAILIIAFGVIPFFIDDYWANAILIHFLVYALAALGLNILTDIAGRCHWAPVASWRWGRMHPINWSHFFRK